MRRYDGKTEIFTQHPKNVCHPNNIKSTIDTTMTTLNLKKHQGLRKFPGPTSFEK